MRKYVIITLLVLVFVAFGAHTMNDTWTGYINASGLTTFLIPGSSTNGQILTNSSGQIGGVSKYGTATQVQMVTGSPVSVCAEYDSNGNLKAAASGLLCGSGGGGGSVGTPSLGGTGWTTVDRLGGGRCATGNVSLASGTFTYPGGTASAAAAALQEIPLFSGLNGDMRYDHVQLTIVTQFTQGASVTDLQAGIGRSGSSSTDNEMQSNFSLFQAANMFGFDRPQPPVVGTANTYSLALSLRTTGGNVSNLTAGNVLVEVCGYSIN